MTQDQPAPTVKSHQSHLLRRASSTGFTLIELLVAIGIVVVLMSIAFLALHHVAGSSRENSTKIALKNLQGMLTELETANKLQGNPKVWIWWDGSRVNNVPTGSPNYGTAFWKMPYRVNNNATYAPDPQFGPGNVSTDFGTDRNASLPVINTLLAMNMLMAVEANRSALANIPQNQQMVPEWQQGEVRAPGADYFLETPDDQKFAVIYVPGIHVKHQGKLYVSTSKFPNDGSTGQANTSNPMPNPNGTTNDPWYEETSNPRPAPLILDGWGKPIIFVPATGLRVLLKNGRTNYGFQEGTPTDRPEQHFIVVTPDGQVRSQGRSENLDPWVVKPGRPFFASAGPDGNFATGDDNIYSFQP